MSFVLRALAPVVSTDARTNELFRQQHQLVLQRTDRLFAGLMLFQWLAAVAVAVWISPLAWSGRSVRLHEHVYAAVLLGLAIISLPVALAMLRPGRSITRHSIALSQALMSALLIHLTGGRIETHFHVFGSLALLAFYRDWRVLLTASTVVAADHFVRGLFWPESVYGTTLVNPWRFAEHAGWVVVEDIFLIIACQQGLREMLEVAQRQANLEVTNKHLSGANEQLRAEIEQHQRTQQELEIARDTAEAANRAKSEFLANMSHELRTPLNAIIGFSDVLSEQVFGPLNENQQQYVTDVLDSGQHLLSLVNDILDLAKVESGAMEVEWKVVQLPALVERTLQMFRERAMRHGVRLQAELSPELSSVAVDERRLKQLLYNFLSNALKFTPEGGEINVRARCTAEHVTISVADTGVGIAPAEQQKIFDTFYQVDSSLTKSQQGTGLGLTLVRKIAELHEGRVWVESEPGYGSEFFFQWPRREAVDPAEGQADVFATTFRR
jgi:signal transduction histidine kinase